MLSVLLTIHMIACVALVIAVMLQRSEGGALGMGGGGTGGIISGRGAASVLVKTTMGLAAVFFCTSIIMTRLNNEANAAPSTLEQQQQRQTPADPFAPVGATPSTTTPATTPSTTAPAAPAPAPTVDPPPEVIPAAESPARPRPAQSRRGSINTPVEGG